MNLEHRPDLHRVATPEGTDLHLQVAGVAERLVAFTIDGLLLLLCWLLALLCLVFASSPGLGVGPLVVLILFVFLSAIFYFPFFELRWNGATPGKRRMRLRVVRADGGPLTSEAVLARNFMRVLEVQVPLVFLAAPQHLVPGHAGWLQLVGGVWVLALMLLPLCNRAHQRAGDFVAGTRVVAMPEARLLPDLARARAAPAPAAAALPPPRFEFTREQLEIYGIYELQVLEDVLRKIDAPDGRQAAKAVAERIQQKIGFAAGAAPPSPREFLQEFYAAQRRHLEQKLLLGRRQERKRGPGKGGPDKRVDDKGVDGKGGAGGARVP